MREKYIEERHHQWLSMTINGRDVDDVEGDIATAKSREDADAFINEHNKLLSAFVEMALAWSDADNKQFSKYWYDQSWPEGE